MYTWIYKTKQVIKNKISLKKASENKNQVFHD